MSSRRADSATAPRDVLAGLDDEQREAVAATRGPVCILAGAGTGKTRTITHRIAYAVLTGDVPVSQLLAVTFTARAAGEMRGRLRGLGVAGVQALTFHAAALRQLRYFWPRLTGVQEQPQLIERKAQLVAQVLSRARQRTDRTTVRDVTGEIEWAKARMIAPSAYPAEVHRAARESPLPADVLGQVYAGYEEAKQRAARVDFDDLLLIMSAGLEDRRDVAEEVRARYRHFVVDEYQDVNPLQQRLLDAWLGGRHDVCVVGDASQTIYTFNGASPDYLVDFPRRHPGAKVVRLERDYRSTPQVVHLANQVIAGARGPLARVRLRLVGQREPGPEPRLMEYDSEPEEAEAVATACAALISAGAAPAEIAVLFRTNGQSETYEQALAAADVPYVVRGGERFFERPEVRRAVLLLRGAARSGPAAGNLPATVTDILSAADFAADAPPSGGAAREQWEALRALVGLAEEMPEAGLEQFVEELRQRAQAQHVPTVQGVTLASLHAAKGLEWDAVFLVGLTDGMLPISYAVTDAEIEEERRLLYVGITRARRDLQLSWALARTVDGKRSRRPSRFLAALAPGNRPAEGTGGRARPAPRQRSRRTVPTCRVCGAALFDATARKLGRCTTCPGSMDEEVFARLREWRRARAQELAVPAYVIFTDATLTAIAEARPTTAEALSDIPGVGPRKLADYAGEVLAVLGEPVPEDRTQSG